MGGGRPVDPSLPGKWLLQKTVVVVVVVTFCNHNFVNCKATLILEIKNLQNKIQYNVSL